jgi:hypothetical protein
MSTARERNREALKNSANFCAVIDRAFLEDLRNAEPDKAEQVRLSKEWGKPTVLVVKALSPGEEKEALSYFAGHDVRRIIRSDASEQGMAAAARELAEWVKETTS